MKTYELTDTEKRVKTEKRLAELEAGLRRIAEECGGRRDLGNAAAKLRYIRGILVSLELKEVLK